MAASPMLGWYIAPVLSCLFPSLVLLPPTPTSYIPPLTLSCAQEHVSL